MKKDPVSGLVKKIASILERLEMPYFITESFALTLWGRVRSTADIDLAVELAPQKLDLLARAVLGRQKNLDAGYLKKWTKIHSTSKIFESLLMDRFVP